MDANAEAAGRRIFLCMALYIDERKRIKQEKQRKLLAYFLAAVSKIAEDHQEQQKLAELREYAQNCVSR